MSDLIERLRGYEWRGKERSRTTHEAADLIEAQQAEIARLRDALEKIAADAGVSHDAYERMYRGWRHIATTRIDIAREVLEQKP